MDKFEYNWAIALLIIWIIMAICSIVAIFFNGWHIFTLFVSIVFIFATIWDIQEDKRENENK